MPRVSGLVLTVMVVSLILSAPLIAVPDAARAAALPAVSRDENADPSPATGAQRITAAVEAQADLQLSVNDVPAWDASAVVDLGWEKRFRLPGANGEVNAIVAGPSGEVYVGGTFSFVGGIPANKIAKWNGRSWSALGSGVNGEVRALAVGWSYRVLPPRFPEYTAQPGQSAVQLRRPGAPAFQSGEWSAPRS